MKKTFAEKLERERVRLAMSKMAFYAVFERDAQPVAARTFGGWCRGDLEPPTVVQEGVMARLKRMKKKRTNHG